MFMNRSVAKLKRVVRTMRTILRFEDGGLRLARGPTSFLCHMVTREQAENVNGLRSTPGCPTCFLLCGAVPWRRGTFCRMPQALAAFWKHAARGWRCRNGRPVAITSRHSHRCQHPRQIQPASWGSYCAVLDL